MHPKWGGGGGGHFSEREGNKFPGRLQAARHKGLKRTSISIDYAVIIIHHGSRSMRYRATILYLCDECIFKYLL